MPTTQDLIFSKILLKNKILTLQEVREALAAQKKLEQLGVKKTLGEILQENGLISEELLEKVNQTVQLTEELLRKQMKQQAKFLDQLSQRASQEIEAYLEKDTSSSPLEEQQVSDPFEQETEKFYLSPEGELEVLMKIKKLSQKSSKDLDKHFGKYLILRKLGQGGQSEVYHAKDTITGREVALKILKPDMAEDKEFIERFHREARHLKRLNHPNIVRIYGAGIIQNRHYLAMEFVKGETLADLTRRRKLSIPEACEIVKQITEGLLAAHEKFIVHRDIKMSNILLITDASRYGFEMEDETGFQVKIADFGLAKSKQDTKVTQDNQFMGTAKYLAPEQIQRGECSEKNDIFALGVIFYELLTQKEPFPATSSIGYLRANVEDDPIPPRDLNPKISESLEKVVLKMLEKDPEKRYSTAALKRDLERLERTFWGNQRIVEYWDSESAFYVGHLERRRRKIRRMVTFVTSFILLFSLWLGGSYALRQWYFQQGKQLLDTHPQKALYYLEKCQGLGVPEEERKKLIRVATFHLALKKAKEMEEEELWQDAIVTYKELLQEYPEAKEELSSRLKKVKYFYWIEKAKEAELEDLVEATRLYRQAKKILPERKEADQALDAIYQKLKVEVQKWLDEKQYEKAKEVLKMRKKIDPEFPLEKKLREIDYLELLDEIKELERSGQWLAAYGAYLRLIEAHKKLYPGRKKERAKLKAARKKIYLRYLFLLQKKLGEKAEKKGDYKKALHYYRQALYLRKDQLIQEKIHLLERKLKQRPSSY